MNLAEVKHRREHREEGSSFLGKGSVTKGRQGKVGSRETPCYYWSFSASTFSVCFLRYSSRFFLTPESPRARIAAANKAALADPASPMN